jgi:hypothetical protein
MDLGEKEYFRNVPHSRFNKVYRGLFQKLDQPHPDCDRPWRDMRNIWQWGTSDADLESKVARLGFKLVDKKDCGGFRRLPNIQNRTGAHAFAPLHELDSRRVHRRDGAVHGFRRQPARLGRRVAEVRRYGAHEVQLIPTGNHVDQVLAIGHPKLSSMVTISHPRTAFINPKSRVHHRENRPRRAAMNPKMNSNTTFTFRMIVV